jgi:dTDP-4-amino-4,6-dideoxygalactose transaminase
VVLSGAYEGRCKRHFPDGEPPVASDLDLPLFSFRMDEIRAALLRAELTRLGVRLERFRANYDHVAGELEDTSGIAIRAPVAPGAYLGEALVFRALGGDAEWFAHALCGEGIEARNLGSSADHNVRAFWNWGFMFGDTDAAAVKAMLPNTSRHLEQAVDIPLSSTLSARDCDQLVRAVRKVAAASPRPAAPGARSAAAR